MPAITLDKTASQPRFKAGDVITYTLTVTNTGNVTLAPVTIDDDRLDLADDRCADALAPGQMLSCTGIYTATEGDSGRSLVNTATARGMTPSGEQVTDDDQLSLGYIVVSLGDYFWFDNNRNGTQDAGEPPVVGATVNLRDGVGEIIATTITDANGYDAFTDLAPSTAYQVQFVAPDGTSFTVPDVGSAGTNSVVDQTGLVKFVSPADGLNLYASGTADNATLDAGIVGFDLVVEKSLTAVEPREGGGVRLTFIITPQSWPERRTRWLERDRRVGAGIDGGEHERIGWFLQHPAVDGHGHRRAARRVGRATAGGHRDHGFGDGNAERGLHPAPCG